MVNARIKVLVYIVNQQNGIRTEKRVKGSRASKYNMVITRELTKASDYVLSLEGKDDYTAATIVKHLSKSFPTQVTFVYAV